jgi:hypothetical protein
LELSGSPWLLWREWLPRGDGTDMELELDSECVWVGRSMTTAPGPLDERTYPPPPLPPTPLTPPVWGWGTKPAAAAVTPRE